jgi:hypothetical protein
VNLSLAGELDQGIGDLFGSDLDLFLQVLRGDQGVLDSLLGRLGHLPPKWSALSCDVDKSVDIQVSGRLWQSNVGGVGGLFDSLVDRLSAPLDSVGHDTLGLVDLGFASHL